MYLTRNLNVKPISLFENVGHNWTGRKVKNVIGFYLWT